MSSITSSNKNLLNPGCDLSTVGGLSLITYVFFTLFNINTNNEVFLRLLSIGSNLINHPHYMATYFRAYASWDNIKEYFFSTILAPLILAIGAIACFVFPTEWAPIFFKAYLVSSGYHYSGQTYGISLIYSNKNSIQLNKFHKLVIAFFIYSSYFYNLAHLETRSASINILLGITPHPLGLPNQFVFISTCIIWCAFILYLALNYHLYKTQKSALPTIVHIVVFSQILWFVIGAYNNAFVKFVPFFHSLQYLLITVYANFRTQFNGAYYSLKQLGQFFWSMTFLKYYRLLVILGMVFFVGIPYIIHKLSGVNFLFTSVVISSFMNLHHFIVDGDIWKLRQPKVQKEIFDNSFGERHFLSNSVLSNSVLQ
jgi:hypothetical protein